MLSAEQQAVRSQGIGASEVAAVLGLDPYRTALDVWLDKRGNTPAKEPSDAIVMGHLLEPVVAQRYQLEHPDVTLTEGTTVVGPESYFLATPDRIAERGQSRWLLEIKTRSVYGLSRWGAEGTDQIPPEIMCQVLWQQMVTGLQTDAEVAVLFGNHNFAVYRVGYDAEVVATMQEKARQFWLNNVLGGAEPEVAGESAKAYLRQKWTQVSGDVLEANEEIELHLKELAVAQKTIEAATGIKEATQVALMRLIGDNAGVRGVSGSVSWKPRKGRTTVNWEAVARSLGADLEANQELVQQHTKQSDSTRVFLFTPAKSALYDE